MNSNEIAIVFGVAIVVFATLTFGPYLLFVFPLILLLLFGVGAYCFYRYWERTHGLSRQAYQNAKQKDPNVAEPPTSFDWVEHAMYRESLKQPNNTLKPTPKSGGTP